MNSRKRPHPAKERERQFEGRFEGEVRRRKNKKKNSSKKKSRNIVAVIVVAAILSLTAMIEFFPDFFVAKILNFKMAVIPAIITVASSSSANFIDLKEKYYGTFSQKLIKFTIGMLKIFFHPAACFGIIVSLIFSVSVYAGNHKLYERTASAFVEAVDAFKNYDTDESFDNNTKDLEHSREDQKWLEQYGEEFAKEIETTEITTVEKNMEKNLSGEDYNKIFFQDGKYKIIDWEDQDEINQKVHQKVKDDLNVQRENIFDKSEADGGAPERIKSEISKASENENNADSFGAKEEILETRGNAYNVFPKMSLANLIANGNQALALILFYYGGKQNTILYYFGQSILSQSQCLEFQGISDQTIKNKLLWIKQRYLDIKYVVSDDTVESYYSDKLAEAYQYVAGQY